MGNILEEGISSTRLRSPSSGNSVNWANVILPPATIPWRFEMINKDTNPANKQTDKMYSLSLNERKENPQLQEKNAKSVQKGCQLLRGCWRIVGLKGWAGSEARTWAPEKGRWKGKIQISEGKHREAYLSLALSMDVGKSPPWEIQRKSHTDAEAEYKLFMWWRHFHTRKWIQKPVPSLQSSADARPRWFCSRISET